MITWMLQENGSEDVERAVAVHGAVCVLFRDIRINIVDNDHALQPF
jgi:hypothetical protein